MERREKSGEGETVERREESREGNGREEKSVEIRRGESRDETEERRGKTGERKAEREWGLLYCERFTQLRQYKHF